MNVTIKVGPKFSSAFYRYQSTINSCKKWRPLKSSSYVSIEKMNGISFIYKALIKCCVFHIEENLTVFVFFTFYAFVSISSRERSCSDPSCLSTWYKMSRNQTSIFCWLSSSVVIFPTWYIMIYSTLTFSGFVLESIFGYILLNDTGLCCYGKSPASSGIRDMHSG